MKKTAIILPLLALAQPAFGALAISGKEVGVAFINGTTASAAARTHVHIAGPTNVSSILDGLLNVTVTESEVIIDLGVGTSPVEFSSESFSGFRFFDYSELVFNDNDPSVALPSLARATIDNRPGKTTVTESGGASFAATRVIARENEIFVNFSRLTVIPGEASRVVIALEGAPIPEPSSALLMLVSGGAMMGRRRRY